MLLKNNISKGEVASVHNTHLIAIMENGAKGLLHISETSDYYVRDISSIFKIGEKYDFLIIEDERDSKVKLSWKRINPRYIKNPYEFTIKEIDGHTDELFENLERKLND